MGFEERQGPEANIPIDNGKQFIARAFKEEMKGHSIRPIYGKPYHPKGRGKIEGYHKILYRELICLKKFPLQEGTLEVRPEIQRLEEAGAPGLADPCQRLS